MNEAEERKLYEDWLHQSPEFADTIISAWDVWLGRAALSAQPEPAAPTVVEPDVPAANFGNMEPVASLMTNINSGDVKLVWNDEAFDRALWRETPLYTSPPRTALTDEQIRNLWFAAKPIEDGRPAYWNFARAIEAAHGIGKAVTP